MVIVAEHWIAAASDESRHVEARSNGGTAAPDCASTAQGAAVPRERSEADELGDLPVVEMAELRQLSEQSARDDRADAGDRAQQVFLATPERTGLDGIAELTIEIVEPLLEPADVFPDVALYGGPGESEPIALGTSASR